MQATRAHTNSTQIENIPLIDSNPHDHTSEQDAIQNFLNQRPDLLEPIGIIPGKKPEGVVRLLYENQNGLSSRLANNRKLDKAKDNINDLEIDIYGFNEHQINFQHRDCRRTGFTTLHNGGECLIKGLREATNTLVEDY
jgi:hypothetical protein